ncbi:MAG: cell wall biosynthesis glycosyltransferase [Elusimicrobia bacterium]|nr:MAG: cell wall biosynthesis glycosyltransferase [Elusimicrobiota bacterium]
MTKGLLSVVVPVYNEAASLAEFHRELSQVLRSLGRPCEIVFVDDGSTDETPALLAAIQHGDPSASVVELSRNFGHQAALSAGLELSRGAAVVTMDSDLQHDPALIPAMLARWEAGALVVTAVREDDPSAGAAKKLSSALFYRAINLLSDTPVTAHAPDFRLLDRKAVDALNAMKESHRFLRGMVGWLGFSQASISFKPRPRRGGRAGYTWPKMAAFALDGIVSFSTRPLRLALWLGVAALTVTTCYALYILGMSLFTAQLVKGWASIVLLVMFLGSSQLVLLGIFGEYIGRIYEQVKGRPLFLVREVRPGRDRG